MSTDVLIPSTPDSRSKSKKLVSGTSSKSAKKRQHHETSAADQAPSVKKKQRRASEIKHEESPVLVKDSQETPSESTSPFYEQTSTFYVSLSPVAEKQPLEGLCAEHLSPLILTYYAPLKGVVLGYSNPRLTSHPTSQATGDYVVARSIAEYAVCFVWLAADFLVFRPQAGDKLRGYVNIQNESHLGLICYNLFNASIERRHLPTDWQFRGPSKASKIKNKKAQKSVEEDLEAETEEDYGTFVDAAGEPIRGFVDFRVKDVESLAAADKSSRGFLSILGTMLSAEEENNLKQKDGQKGVALKRSASKIGTVRKSKSTNGTPRAGVDREDSY